VVILVSAQVEQRVLAAICAQVPLAEDPWAAIAQHANCSEQQVLEAIASLRAEGVVREISAIFDVTALGYRQVLIAMAAPPERLEASGNVISGHPGVSHCYSRRREPPGEPTESDYNLWFTLAVSPRSELGLQVTADVLAAACDCDDHLLLPSLRQFKLSMPLGLAPAAKVRRKELSPLTEPQARAIRALQADLPAEPNPFEPLARQAAMSISELLAIGRGLLADGRMRRYAAVVHHRIAGATENVLVAWDVPDDQAAAAGNRCARSDAVSHCYLRPRGDQWPYNLYTMIHGRARADCELAIEQLAATADLHRRAQLWTLKEFKKRRVPLCGSEEADWERG
jgi:DNA-binding Lrp family transcriptional regulator